MVPFTFNRLLFFWELHCKTKTLKKVNQLLQDFFNEIDTSYVMYVLKLTLWRIFPKNKINCFQKYSIKNKDVQRTLNLYGKEYFTWRFHLYPVYRVFNTNGTNYIKKNMKFKKTKISTHFFREDNAFLVY